MKSFWRNYTFEPDAKFKSPSFVVITTCMGFALLESKARDVALGRYIGIVPLLKDIVLYPLVFFL